MLKVMRNLSNTRDQALGTRKVYYGTMLRQDRCAQLGFRGMGNLETQANHTIKRIRNYPKDLIDNSDRFLCTDTLEVCSVDLPFRACLMVHFYTEAPKTSWLQLIRYTFVVCVCTGQDQPALAAKAEALRGFGVVPPRHQHLPLPSLST